MIAGHNIKLQHTTQSCDKNATTAVLNQGRQYTLPNLTTLSGFRVLGFELTEVSEKTT
jgi:hypothetical protein